MTTSDEKPYVFGTHSAELERLGLQHRVWRPDVTDAWRRAGFTAGQTLLDIGCGPGFASLDLAEIVGPIGRIIAADRSADFLKKLNETAQSRHLENISTTCINFDEAELAQVPIDGAYARWVFAFLRNPRKLLERVVQNLRSDGTLVIHEYFHYRTFRLTPALPIFDAFVDAAVRAWNADGGEPNIAPSLLQWCEELGLHVESLRPIVHIVSPESYIWQWPKSFVKVSAQRLVDIGHFTSEQYDSLQTEFAAVESDGHTRVITPAVLEIIAKK
jgi:ubiquinone/menaquinone biosynthesis C-methylase UbiE